MPAHLVPADVNLLEEDGVLKAMKGYSQDIREVRIRGDVTCKFDENALIVSVVGSASSKLIVATPKDGQIELGFEVLKLPEEEKKRAEEVLAILPIGCFMSAAGYLCVPLPLAEEIIQRLPTRAKIFHNGEHLDLACEIREVLKEIPDPDVRDIGELLMATMFGCCTFWEAQVQLTRTKNLLCRLMGDVSLNRESTKLLLAKIDSLLGVMPKQ